MRRLLTALACGALGVSLAACGPSPITSGTVLQKQDIPAHSQTVNIPQYRTQCTMEEEGSTDEDVCTQVLSYYLPETFHYSESWRLDVKGAKRTGWVDVSQTQYNQAKVGAQWTKPGSASSTGE